MTHPLRFTALVVLAVAPIAYAHHGWSDYDASRNLKLTGTIQEAGYEHPHGYLKLQTPGKEWLAVLAPPSRMDKRGLTRELLKVGNTATVEG